MSKLDEKTLELVLAHENGKVIKYNGKVYTGMLIYDLYSEWCAVRDSASLFEIESSADGEIRQIEQKIEELQKHITVLRGDQA